MNKKIAKAFMKWKADTLRLPELNSQVVQDFIDDCTDEELERWFDYMESPNSLIHDGDLCPFCFILGSDCLSCTWRTTYGECGDPESFYTKHILPGKSFTDILGKATVCNKIKSLKEEYL